MRYVYAALIATATIAPWIILALHTRACRQAGAANLHEAVAELATAEADIRHITHRISPRPDPDPPAARPYVTIATRHVPPDNPRTSHPGHREDCPDCNATPDAPDDVLDEPPAPGWLTVSQAAAVGQHPYVDHEIAGVPRCGHPGCGAISGDPVHFVHFVATGILNQPGVTTGGDPDPIDPLPGC